MCRYIWPILIFATCLQELGRYKHKLFPTLCSRSLQHWSKLIFLHAYTDISHSRHSIQSRRWKYGHPKGVVHSLRRDYYAADPPSINDKIMPVAARLPWG